MFAGSGPARISGGVFTRQGTSGDLGGPQRTSSGDGYLQPCRFVSGDNSGSTASEIHSNLDILHFMSDELKENPDNENDLLSYRSDKFAFYTWQQDTGVDQDLRYVGGDEAYWNMLYEKINTCNMVLALIDEQPASREEDVAGRERVKGEAYFLRAAYYFLLANLYAQPYLPQTAASTPGVPIKLSEYVEDREFTREPLATVYAQVLADLEQAEACLQGKEHVSVYHADLTATLLLPQPCVPVHAGLGSRSPRGTAGARTAGRPARPPLPVSGCGCRLP